MRMNNNTYLQSTHLQQLLRRIVQQCEQNEKYDREDDQNHRHCVIAQHRAENVGKQHARIAADLQIGIELAANAACTELRQYKSMSHWDAHREKHSLIAGDFRIVQRNAGEHCTAGEAGKCARHKHMPCDLRIVNHEPRNLRADYRKCTELICA